MARELAEKLERDAELERRRLLRKSEHIARSLQQEQNQIRVEGSSSSMGVMVQQQRNGTSAGAPVAVENELPIPPRNVNHRINGRSGVLQQHSPPPPPVLPPDSSTTSSSNTTTATSSSREPINGLELNYACLDLPQQNQKQPPAVRAKDQNSAALYDTIFNVIEDPQARRNLLMKHTPEKAVPYNVSLHDPDSSVSASSSSHGGAKSKHRHQYSDELSIDVDLQNRNYQKLSPAKFDLLMGNEPPHRRGNSYDSTESGGAGGSTSGSATDPTLETLKMLGLPSEELKEMGRRARQERIDEELARKLQEQLAQDDMSQEEKDRMVDMEAQDKELARLLQEREKAKAKRAKERARLKKLQREQEAQMMHEEGPGHHGPEMNDSYANPVDLVRHEDGDYREGGEDNYSNPVDYLRQQGARLAQNQKSIEELYAQPISKRHSSPQRPNHLELKGPLNRPAPAKAHLPDYPENIAAAIDPTYAQLQPYNRGSRSPTQTSSLDRDYDEYLDEPSPPSPLPPPYMPIQGTRRQGGQLQDRGAVARDMVIPQNYSRMGSDPKGRAKKNKEKCAQQ